MEEYDKLLISLLTVWSLVITYHRTYDFFVLIVVAALFCTDIEHRNGLLLFYAVLMVYINYVLRIFSENTASKAGAALLYYIFAIALSIIAFRGVRENG